jgi:hypothetical protein
MSQVDEKRVSRTFAVTKPLVRLADFADKWIVSELATILPEPGNKRRIRITMSNLASVINN